VVTASVLAACGSGGDEGSGAKTDNGGRAATEVPAPVAAIVTYLQHDLDVLNLYEGRHDGVFSRELVDALKTFQTQHSLDASGALDAATSLAMAKALGSGESLLSVRALQEVLADVERITLVADGIYGAETEVGVRDAQKAAGLDETGAYDAATAGALAMEYVARYPDAQPHPTAPTTTGVTTTASGAEGAGLLQQGDEGDAVADLQRKLAALGYRPGEPDGQYGPATTSAVMAFEKHEGLERDGVAGPEVLNRLASPTGAGPKSTDAATPRVEIDLARQIVFVVTNEGTTILNTSTGSGERYNGSDGPNELAFTPNGDFTVQRKVDGPVKAPLGTLYKPSYFYQGWALHGAASVPAYPASHGCARLSNADADWIFPLIPVGTPVIVYGPSTPNGPALQPSGDAEPGA